jgi:hypothetical protein
MSVTLDKIQALHIHVGANIPGYLPESDVFCFDSVDDALSALRDELKRQQDYYFEQCEGTSPEQQEKGSECCGWCDAAYDVEASLGAIADGDTANHMRNGTGRLNLFSGPEGPSVAHWAMFADGDRDACEIFAAQES